MTLAALLFCALAAAGWTAILTRGAGPFGILARLRAAWPGGPLGCPLCTGTWTGAALAAGLAVAELVPRLAAGLAVLAAAGAGAAVAELYQLAADALRQSAWSDRQAAELAQAQAGELTATTTDQPTTTETETP